VFGCAQPVALSAVDHGSSAAIGASPQTGTEPIVSTRSASFDLPPNSSSVPAARHIVLELLHAWRAPQDHDDAALLVTELVANVVDHVGGEASLTLELVGAESWLRIGVIDGSAIPPVVQELSQDRPRGRGLLMVQAIAERWGFEEHHGGKRVWFELGPSGRWA
jgi:hypothetical protein